MNSHEQSILFLFQHHLFTPFTGGYDMKKTLVCSLILVIMIFNFSFSVSAHSNTITSGHSISFHENNSSSISPRAYIFCSSCGSRAFLKCNYFHLSNAGVTYDTSTHGSCTVRWCKSLGVYVCSNSSCGKKTSSGMWHDCYTSHSSCGKGVVLECTLVIVGG